MKRTRFDAAATAEFDAAADWYEARQPGLGNMFIDAVEEAALRIRENPAIGSPYLDVDPRLEVRQIHIHKFPYVLAYMCCEDHLVVLAVAHGHRRPGYWHERLP